MWQSILFAGSERYLTFFPGHSPLSLFLLVCSAFSGFGGFAVNIVHPNPRGYRGVLKRPPWPVATCYSSKDCREEHTIQFAQTEIGHLLTFARMIVGTGNIDVL